MRLRDGLSLGSDVVIDSATNITSKDFYVDSSLPTVKPTLNLNFAKTKSLDPRITFTRASTASYIDQYGVIKYAAINEPRFDYDPLTGECKGLLIEEQRTNLVPYSEDLRHVNEDGFWWTSTSGINVVANATTAPDGNMSADNLIATNSSTAHNRYYAFGWSYSTTYTASVYVKSAGHRYAFVKLGNALFGDTDILTVIDFETQTVITNSTVGHGIAKLNNGWFRIWVTATTISSGSGSATISIGLSSSNGGNFTGNNVDGVYAWGAQLEVGAYPTSYIPTLTTTVTREYDLCTVPVGGWYNQSEGTVVSKQYMQKLYSTTGAAINWTWGLQTLNTSSISFYEWRWGGTIDTNINLYYSAGAGSLGVSKTFPAEVKSATAFKLNDVAYTVNGESPKTGTSFIPNNNIGYLTLGRNLNSTRPRHIQQITYYPVRLPNAILQELTK